MQQGNQPQTVVHGFGFDELKQQAELAAISVSATARAMVEAKFIMALKRPRNEQLARTRLLDRCKDPNFADSAIYAKPIGGSTIEGLSIRFVEEALALWGNVYVKSQVLYEDDFRRITLISVTDLETNITHDSEISVDKTVERKKAGSDREILRERLNTANERVFIVRATEDETNVKTAAGVSKQLRNNGLRCLPGHLKEEAFTIMNKVLEGKIKDNPEAEKRKIIDAFNELSIKPDRLEEFLGHALDIATPAEIAGLRKIWNALKAGDTTWTEVMASKGEPAAKEPEKGQLSNLRPGDASTHTSPGQPLTDRQKLLAEASSYEKTLTKEVFWKSIGGLGFENLDAMNDQQLKDLIKNFKEKLAK